MMDSNLFDNPAFANLSPEKLQFLNAFAQKEKPTSPKEILPFLMANMQAAKKQQIEFSRPEIALLCDLLTRDLPPQEQARAKKVMAICFTNRT